MNIFPFVIKRSNEIVESVQDFQYRRCIKNLDMFIEEGEPFGIWK